MQAIAERIKQLDIQDCKVRVLNVDSQESLKNILVQVIGEMSNKAEPHRKFVQSFVLAEQPSGYYVLNDVFRYIVLDEDEFENGTGSGPAETIPPASGPDAPSLATQPQATLEQADSGLEEDTLPQASANKDAAGDVSIDDDVADTPAEIQADDAPVAAIVEPQVSSEVSEATVESTSAQEEVEPEKPKDLDPTPVASPPKPAVAQAAQPEPASEPLKPAAPKTWANLVAANRATAPAPAIPNGPSQAASAASASTKPKVSSVKESVTPPAPTAEENQAKPQQNGNAGWQTAGATNEKRQNRQHSQSVSASHESVLGYVKNVTDKVDASILKEKLNQQGKLAYFDVSRQKVCSPLSLIDSLMADQPQNCAFVEFVDLAAYNSAIAANPYLIGGEQVIVEERRPRSTAYGGNFANRGGMRGGRGGNENRPNNQGRGNFNKDGARGGYNNRSGRGGPIANRGRTGQAQAV